jgi:high affinity Mn2+ porin
MLPRRSLACGTNRARPRQKILMPRTISKLVNWLKFWMTAMVLVASAHSQSAPAVDDPVVTSFPHSQTSPYWISGQDNIIFQWHPSFDAPYSGAHSLRSQAEHATSNVATIFLGYQLSGTTEVFADAESAAGGGLSDALGLAGFVNVDVVRNPELGPSPYLARAMIRQIIPLGSETTEAERGPLALATSLPVRRLELRAGKFGMADFFDLNESGSDSHSQFMNWTVDNNGAYDYAADTRGYTVGVIAEYDDRNWAFRFAESLMPKVANGPDLDWNLRRARAENYELEIRPRLVGNRVTTLRLLSFVNHANMGVYRQAINDFLAGRTPRPEIRAHPLQTTVKYGFGVNLEQELPHHVRGFARWGWNEGQHESYAYTEVDQTIQAGADLAGNSWHRRQDKLGGVFVSNGISADHQKYLALGGLGFLLGDGALNYGRENIFESYYNAHVWRGIFAGVDLQHINHPGYNRDRGPVLVPGFRFHLDF